MHTNTSTQHSAATNMRARLVGYSMALLQKSPINETTLDMRAHTHNTVVKWQETFIITQTHKHSAQMAEETHVVRHSRQHSATMLEDTRIITQSRQHSSRMVEETHTNAQTHKYSAKMAGTGRHTRPQ